MNEQEQEEVSQNNRSKLLLIKENSQRSNQESDDTFRRGSSLGSYNNVQVVGSRQQRSNAGGSSQKSSQAALHNTGQQQHPSSQSSNAMPQKAVPSKATSLVRRKTSEIDEDDMEYSDSNAGALGTHYFQLDSTSAAPGGDLRRKRGAGSSVVPVQEEEDDDKQFDASRIINDVNNECTQLISNLMMMDGTQQPNLQPSASRVSQGFASSAVIRNSMSSSSGHRFEKASVGSSAQDLARTQHQQNSKSVTGVGDQDDCINVQVSSSNKARIIENQVYKTQDPTEPVSEQMFTQQQQDRSRGVKNVGGTVASSLGGAAAASGLRLNNDSEAAISKEGGKTTTTAEAALYSQNLRESESGVPCNSNEVPSSSAHYHASQKILIGADEAPIYINQIPSSGRDSMNGSRQSIARNKTDPRNYRGISAAGAGEAYTLNPYAQAEDNPKGASSSHLNSSNKITFRQLQPRQDAASPHSSMIMNQAQFDLQNFNAFTHQHFLGSNDETDHELSRAGDSIIQGVEALALKGSHLISNKGEVASGGELGNTLSGQRYENHMRESAQPTDLAREEDQEDEESEYEDDEDMEGDDEAPQKEDLHPVVSKEAVPPPAEEQKNNNPFTDDVVYNRLPKNFFVQEAEEQFDLSNVMASIKQMRQDFVGYVNESKVQDKLDEISDLIIQPPEQFIERQLKAMGLNGGEELLFEQIIQQSPAPSSTTGALGGRGSFKASNSITMRDTTEPVQPDFMRSSVRSSQKRLQQQEVYNAGVMSDSSLNQKGGRVQFCEPISTHRRSIEEAATQKGNVEEIEERLRKKDYEQFPLREKDETLGSPKSASLVGGGASKQQRGTNVVLQYQVDKQEAIKNLKMADYFKGDKERGLDSRTPSPPPLSSNSGDELSEEIKQNLIQRNKQDVLGNLSINFLFNQGDRLRHGLIDQHRLYKIMLKIKEVAQKQIESHSSTGESGSSKQIDYTQIVRYLEEEDEFQAEGEGSQIHIKKNAEQMSVANAEPRKSKFPHEENVDEIQWVQVVEFMRKNPKLMLQMLPGDLPSEDIPNTSQSAQNVTQAQLNAAKQAEEARKLQKLKQLSSKWMNNRKEFLEAIDKYQEKQLISSPKNSAAAVGAGSLKDTQQPKLVKVKSITSNQRRVKRAHQQQFQKDNQYDSSNIIADSEDPRATSQEAKRAGDRAPPLHFEKHFFYTSANQAKGIYNAAPYSLPPLNDNIMMSSMGGGGSGSDNEGKMVAVAEQQQNYQQHSMLDKLATKTQIEKKQRHSVQSQQHKSFTHKAQQQPQTQFTNYKKDHLSGAASNMSSNLDATTLTGTQQNQFGPKNSNNFRNNIASQIQTISQEDTVEAAVASTTSMFHKFSKPAGGLISGETSSQRRPITANAAMNGAHRHNKHKINVYNQQQMQTTELSAANNVKSSGFIPIARQPSASGVSSNFNTNNQILQKGAFLDNVSETQQQPQMPGTKQYPKFVSEKRISWLNSGQHILQVAKQTEELNENLNQVEDQQLPRTFKKRTKTQREAGEKARPLRRRLEAPPPIMDPNEVAVGSAGVDLDETSPERRTQEFIDKIAPNIRHNDMYPKFVQRARKHTPSSVLSKESEGAQSSALKIGGQVGSSLNSSMNQVPIDRVKRIVHNPKRGFLSKESNTMVNLSQASFKDQHQATEQDQQSQASSRLQGEYPKFIKDPKKYQHLINKKPSQPQRQSNSSANPLVEFQSQTAIEVTPTHPAGSQHVRAQSNMSSGERKSSVNQGLQTRIGGLGNRLLVSPKHGGYNKGEVEGCQFDEYDSQNESEEGSLARRKLLAQNRLLLPIVDWAFTPLFTRALKEADLTFNVEKDISMYEEKEVDYVIDMMKNKYKDFKRSDIMRPFYLKAQLTLKEMFIEQGQESHFEKLMYKYKEVTIENTMKLLIRCKLNFHARQCIFEILNLIVIYELNAVQFKEIVTKYSKHKVDQSDLDVIKEAGMKVVDSGHQFLVKIKALRTVHKQYRSPFIFKQKDYVTYVRNEMSEARKLMGVFKIRTEEDILEEERLAKEAEDKRLREIYEREVMVAQLQELGVNVEEAMAQAEAEQKERERRQALGIEDSEEEESVVDSEEERKKMLSPLRINQ